MSPQTISVILYHLQTDCSTRYKNKHSAVGALGGYFHAGLLKRVSSDEQQIYENHDYCIVRNKL